MNFIGLRVPIVSQHIHTLGCTLLVLTNRVNFAASAAPYLQRN